MLAPRLVPPPLLLLCLSFSCATDVADSEPGGQQRLDDALAELSTIGLADDSSAVRIGEVARMAKKIDFCAQVRPVLEILTAQDDLALIQQAFFVGGTLEAGTFVSGEGGVDLVWDLYSGEFSMFLFYGPELTYRGAGGSAGVHIGAGFGMDHGVAEWEGYFYSISGGVNIPGNLLSVGAGLFSSAPGWLRAPDLRIYGTIASASVGFDLLQMVGAIPPSLLEGEVSEGRWYRQRWFNRGVAARDWWLAAELTDEGVVRYGNHRLIPGDSYTERGILVGASILETLGPAGSGGAIQAITLGVLRDIGIESAMLECLDRD